MPVLACPHLLWMWADQFRGPTCTAYSGATAFRCAPPRVCLFTCAMLPFSSLCPGAGRHWRAGQHLHVRAALSSLGTQSLGTHRRALAAWAEGVPLACCRSLARQRLWPCGEAGASLHACHNCSCSHPTCWLLQLLCPGQRLQAGAPPHPREHRLCSAVLGCAVLCLMPHRV